MLLGSRAVGNVHKNSDLDLLVVIKDINTEAIDRINLGKQKLAEEFGVDVAVNLHTEGELRPALKKAGLFIHRNRVEMFVLKCKYQSQLIYGDHPLSGFADPSPRDIRSEAVKVIQSFGYFLKKYLLNPELAPHGDKEFVRAPIICVEYLAAFHGRIVCNAGEAISWLHSKGLLKKDCLSWLDSLIRLKKSGVTAVDSETKIKATRLVSSWAAELAALQLQKGISDWRLIDGKLGLSGDLSRPQAVVMAVLPGKAHGMVLMVQRTHDDYLAPNAWSLPGGYIKPGETPAHAVSRELDNELGVTAACTPLFNGRPLISKRCAIYAFTDPARLGAVPNLREYRKCAFLVPDASMNMTEEARLVLIKSIRQGRR